MRTESAGQYSVDRNREAASSLSCFRGLAEARRPGDPDVIMSVSAYRAIIGHLGSDRRNELGGLLLGHVDSAATVIYIEKSLPARFVRSTPVSLTFLQDSWAEFDRTEAEWSAQGVNYTRVGWYHSHPGMGIFLSGHDLDVCKSFRLPHHVALVVDPIEPKGGFFVHGADGYRNHSPQGFWEYRDIDEPFSVGWRNIRPDRAAIAVKRPAAWEPRPAARFLQIGKAPIVLQPEAQIHAPENPPRQLTLREIVILIAACGAIGLGGGLALAWTVMTMMRLISPAS